MCHLGSLLSMLLSRSVGLALGIAVLVASTGLMPPAS
jgi:hypothetical protein